MLSPYLRLFVVVLLLLEFSPAANESQKVEALVDYQAFF
jgi:hypothetical protein